MKKDDAVAETKFRIAKSIFSTLQVRGLITDEDMAALLRATAKKYRPPLGELEVNSIAGEKGYKG